jgi:hypothetical protein
VGSKTPIFNSAGLDCAVISGLSMTVSRLVQARSACQETPEFGAEKPGAARCVFLDLAMKLS